VSRQKILWIAVMVLCVTTAQFSFGQDAESGDYSDLEGWTAAELKYKVSKKWMLAAEGQLRVKDDMSVVDQYFAQFGVKFAVQKDISLDGGLRFIRQNDTQGKIQGYESERRHHLSGSYGPKLGRFSLGFRVRYQTKGDAGPDGYQETDRYFRFRAKVRYNIRNWKFDPNFAAELYHPVDSEFESDFDKVRFTLGTDWEAWTEGEIGMFYRYEKELGVELPRTTHIIGLRFAHTLGRN